MFMLKEAEQSFMSNYMGTISWRFQFLYKFISLQSEDLPS